MPNYVPWQDIKDKSEGRFLKWPDGKSRFRLITGLMTYQANWPDGIKEEFVAYVLDENLKPRIAQLKQAMLGAFKTYAEESGDPTDAQAGPIWIVNRTGSNKGTKYSCQPGKSMPLPADINVAALAKELEEYVNKRDAEFKAGKPAGKSEDDMGI